MAGYSDTKQMIINALMGRPEGTQIQPEDHQAFALQIIDYIRSVELVAGNATPIGFADADTVPVQPYNGQAVYLSSVSGSNTVTFTNFIDQNGNAISVTSTTNVIKLVTLLWNGQYWSSQVTSVNAVCATDGYLFMGVATKDTSPNTPNTKVFYIADGKGVYTNFDGISVTEDEVVILYYDTAWHKEVTGIASNDKLTELESEINTEIAKLEKGVIYDVTANNNGVTFASLSTLLSDKNLSTLIPVDVRCGGMNIRFVQSSDNKYVQYRLTNQNWSIDVNDWTVGESEFATGEKVSKTGIDNEPTAGSNNLVKSGGVKSAIPEIIDNLTSSDSTKTLSANQGKVLNDKIEGEYSYSEINYPNTDFTYPYCYTRQDILQNIVELGLEIKSIQIPIPKNIDSIEAYALFGSQYYYGVYFTSSDGTSFISGLPIYSGNRNFYHRIEKNDIPSNAHYIVVVAGTNQYDNFKDVYVKFNLKTMVSAGLRREIAELNSRVDNTLNDSSDLVQVKKSYTYYVGAREDFEQYYFPVSKGDKIIVNTTYAFAYGGVLRVKNNGNIVQSYVSYSQFVDYEFNITSDGDLYFYCSSFNSSNSTITMEIYKYATQDTKNFTDYVKGLDCLPKDVKEIAAGSVGLVANSEVAEKLGTCNMNNVHKYFVNYDNFEFNNYLNNNKNIVVFNHDDLQPNDWITTRKIYEKYGMNANFSMIVSPFKSVSDKNDKIYGIKKLLKGGNKIGLHSVLNITWFFSNPLFDVRPNGTSTFAPSLQEIKGSNSDGTGVNTFGTTITLDTTVSQIGFLNAPSSLASVKVVDLTQEQYNTLVQHYTWFGNAETITGLDLNDNERTGWKKLKWLEYWYNCLISSSEGFTDLGDITERFTNDYDVPSGATANDYYPEAKQLLEGKVIYYNDTLHPHFSEALVKTDSNFTENSYQLVGKFKRGLYKDCYSTCNYEVLNKIIGVMNAFVKFYYGLNGFNDYNRHGIGYANFYWINSESGLRYNERTKTKLDSADEKLYFTQLKAFSTIGDVLKANGITNLHQVAPLNAILEGETGLWFGQKGCIKDFQAKEVQTGDVIDYLCVATPSSSDPSGSLLSYSDLITFLSGVEDRTKYFFENADTTKTRSEKTLYIPNDLQKIILSIVGALGTGRVPIISLDTINGNANNSMGVDLVLRFCRELGIRVVDIETARQLCTSFNRDYVNNWFPNSKFNQSLLNYFGGTSANNLAYTPDGFRLSSTANVGVNSVSIDGKQVNILSVNGGSATTTIFGLQPGSYRLSFYAKSTNNLPTSKINFFIKKNSDYIDIMYGGKERYQPTDSFNPTSSYTLHEYEFVIPEYERRIDDTSDVNRLCCGYDKNVGKIVFQISSPDETIYIYNPKIKIIS